MSFLNELQQKKCLLKNTQTVVTNADGRRFIDSVNGKIPLEDVKYGFIVDTKPDKVPSLVINNVYLGSQDCCEIEVLTKYQIEYVLSIGIKPIFDIPPNVKQTFVECLDLPETNIKNVIFNCIPIMRRATKENKNIFIHCNAGVSRSSAVVIGFLILEHNFTYVDAYNIVKKARNCIKPNVGFEKQLKSL